MQFNISEMKKAAIFLISIAGLINHSCDNRNDIADAYGNFEVQEILVSAEVSGRITEFSLEEGQLLEKGTYLGCIDTLALSLQRDVVIAQKRAVLSKSRNINAELEVLNEQKKGLFTEKNRLESLLKDGAATTKQMDDLMNNIRILEKRILATQTQLGNINAEREVFNKQLDQLNDQIGRAKITSPIQGTVIEKYIEESEMVSLGLPLFKMADMEFMILRAYITGSQLSTVQIGQRVFVYIDQQQNKMAEMEGIVSWISSQAEFTPKIIQTKEERVNLVYAVKIIVENDGRLKVGMPGEVRFISERYE